MMEIIGMSQTTQIFTVLFNAQLVYPLHLLVKVLSDVRAAIFIPAELSSSPVNNSVLDAALMYRVLFKGSRCQCQPLMEMETFVGFLRRCVQKVSAHASAPQAH